MRSSVPVCVAALVALHLGGCIGASEDEDFDPEAWQVEAVVEGDHVAVTADISRYHVDFIHMSIRKTGWDSGYTIDRSPAPHQPARDWSRVHHWFGELHPNTYLEGRIDDGSGQGPADPTTFRFHIPRGVDMARQDFPDDGGSDYEYITSVYPYADGHGRHPSFDAGEYEIQIYPWYTGRIDPLHPSADDRLEVQYLHFEMPLASTTFVIE